MKQPAIRALQAKDLICGMSIDIQKARFKVRYLAKTYHFCSRECLELFNWGSETVFDGFIGSSTANAPGGGDYQFLKSVIHVSSLAGCDKDLGYP